MTICHSDEYNRAKLVALDRGQEDSINEFR